jgi:hypothetical protein
VITRAKRYRYEEFIPYKNSVWIRGEFVVEKNEFLFRQEGLRDLHAGVLQDEVMVMIWMTDYNQELVTLKVKYKFNGSRLERLELKARFEFEEIKSEYTDYVDLKKFRKGDGKVKVRFNFRLFEENLFNDTVQKKLNLTYQNSLSPNNTVHREVSPDRFDQERNYFLLGQTFENFDNELKWLKISYKVFALRFSPIKILENSYHSCEDQLAYVKSFSPIANQNNSLAKPLTRNTDSLMCPVEYSLIWKKKSRSSCAIDPAQLPISKKVTHKTSGQALKAKS